jgi:hypothetical protein
MSVTSRWTGPEPSRMIPALERLKTDTLASVLALLRRGAESAYAGTRFAGTFLVHEDALFSSDPLFIVVEEPTRPHAIDAKAASYLHFQVHGHWVRVTHVDHPGTAGKRLLVPLFDVFGAEMGARLARGWEDLGRGL